MFWLPFSLLNSFFESVASAWSKHSAQKIDVFSTAWAQRFFALFILLPFVLITHSFQSVPNTFWLALISTSLLNTFNSLLFIRALKISPLSFTLPLITFTPAFLLITSPLMINEFPHPLGVLGVILVVVGSYILNLHLLRISWLEPIKAVWQEPGARLMLLVAFIWSITSNIDKVAINNSNPILFSLLSNFSVLVFLTLIFIVMRISFKPIFKASRILAPVGIASGLSTLFQMIAVSLTVVPNAIAIKRTSTIFGVLWGKLFFKEEHIRERLMGVGVMVLGVVLIALS